MSFGAIESVILSVALVLLGFRRPIQEALGLRALRFYKAGDVVFALAVVVTFLASILFLSD